MGSEARFLGKRLKMIAERLSCRASQFSVAVLGLILLLLAPGWSSGQPAEPRCTRAPEATSTIATVSEAGKCEAAEDNVHLLSEDRYRLLKKRLDTMCAPGRSELSLECHRNVCAACHSVPRVRGDGSFNHKSNQPDSQDCNRSAIEADPRPSASTTSSLETLTRAKYRLPAALANRAADVIREHFSDEIHVSVSDAQLTVIASPSDQDRIAGFIDLLRARRGNSTPKGGF
jgi:hypothetical protein